uniref:Uncharacterized protein n=3 Tax=Oryza TaxID=4527 RepID=Q75IC1_ORYSJ|nr:hypothetical protein [Oryza sativa Japonica Group]ABF97319.1 hypothetical protein LOC_Os03g38650 [Oryza sativa Japonica Group]
MVGAEGWRRLRRCSSYRGCSSSTNGGGGRGVGGCVVLAQKATAYARVTRVGDDGMDETLLSNLPYNSDYGYSSGGNSCSTSERLARPAVQVSRAGQAPAKACGPNLAARNWLGFTGAIPSFLTVYVCKINSKYLSGLSSNKKMVGKETTGQIALDDITPMDMAL